MEVTKGYKHSDIGIIPIDWNVDSVKNVASINTGAKNTQDKIDDGEYPFFVRSSTVERINSYSFDGEAVLTAGDGVGTGKVYHYINGKFDFHQRVYKISNFIDEVDGYFFYLFFSNNFLKRIISMTAKSSVDSVRMDMIANMEIPIPPKKEQNAIAQVLSDTDEQISSLEKLIEKKKLIKQGTMQQLLTGKKRLPGFTQEWTEVHFSELADDSINWSLTGGPFGSNLKAEEYTSDGVRIIQLQNIGDGYFNDDYKIFTSEKKANELLSCNIYPGEIILSKMGDPVARACFIPEEGGRFLMASDGIRLSINKKYYNKIFVKESINSPFFRNQAITNSTGTTRLRISLGTLKNLILILPSISEQNAIAEILNEIDSEIELLEQKLNKYKAIKQGMMQNLLTGKIRLV